MGWCALTVSASPFSTRATRRGCRATVLLFCMKTGAAILWAVQETGEIVRRHQGRFTTYTEVQGVPSDVIPLGEDEQGNLLLFPHCDTSELEFFVAASAVTMLAVSKNSTSISLLPSGQMVRLAASNGQDTVHALAALGRKRVKATAPPHVALPAGWANRHRHLSRAKRICRRIFCSLLCSP